MDKPSGQRMDLERPASARLVRLLFDAPASCCCCWPAIISQAGAQKRGVEGGGGEVQQPM